MNGIYISPKPLSCHSINIGEINFAGDYQLSKTLSIAVTSNVVAVVTMAG